MVANQSAQTWKYTAQNWENMYNKTYQQLQLANQTIRNQVVLANTTEMIVSVVLGVVAVIIIIAMYIDHRKRQAFMIK